jgi:TolB-like protein
VIGAFEHSAGSPDSRRLARALTRTLIGRLSGVGEIRIGTTASLTRHPDLPGFRLYGSVGQRGSRIRIEVTLVDLSRDQAVYCRRFSEPRGDAFRPIPTVVKDLVAVVRPRFRSLRSTRE